MPFSGGPEASPTPSCDISESGRSVCMTPQFAAVILNGLICNIINMYWEKKNVWFIWAKGALANYH